MALPSPERPIPPLAPLYLMLGLVTMANTILAAALPTVSNELGGARDYTAAFTAYLLPKALMTPVGGRLVDGFPPRRVVALSTLMYLFGSLGCGLAQSMDQLLAFRVLQGCGGGALLASAYTFMDLLVPPRQQGQVQARVALILGLGAAAAPVIGGILTQHLGWRWCFFLNVPPLLLGLVTLLRLPPLQPRGKAQLDFLGLVLLAAAAIPLLLALTWAGSRLPWSSPTLWALLVFSLLCWGAFWFYEKRPQEPLFDPAILSQPVLGLSFLASFCMGGAYLSSLIYLPLYMTVVQGTSPLLAGLAMLPFIIGNIAGAIRGGSEITASGRYRGLGLKGPALAAAASLGLAALLPGPTPLLPFLALQGVLAFAFGLCGEVYNVAVQNVTPMHRQGMTGSALEFVRQLGSALGMAVIGSLLLVSLDQKLPALLKAQVEPLGITMDVSQFEDRQGLIDLHQRELAALRKLAEEASQGNREALQKVERMPFFSAEIKGQMQSGTRPAQLEAELERLSAQIRDRVQSTVAEAVDRAQQEICLLCGLLCLLALALSYRLPDMALREEVT